MNRRQLGRGQRVLMLVVVVGTVAISLIGFVGSYDAVLRLAQRNGFGWFSYVLPIGIDVGITVFLALDLLLTWMRIPLPLLRQLAWVLTGATIVFNAASAWPHPLASGMHAVVPLLFVAAIEAARHTVGRLAQIEANQLFERTRLGRWIFAPVATLRLFRRRVLWELRSYEEALEHERRRLVYRARLRAVYGRLWRFRAPVDLILLLKLANLGETLPEFKLDATPVLAAIAPAVALPAPALDDAAKALLSEPAEEQPAPEAVAGATAPAAAVVPAAAGEEPAGPDAVEAEAAPSGSAEPQPTDPAGPVAAAQQSAAAVAGPDTVGTTVTAPTLMDEAPLPALPVQGTAVDRYRTAFVDYTQRHGAFPDGDQLAKWLFEHYGITGRSGDTLSSGHLRRYLPAFREQWEVEQQASVSTPQ